MKIILTLPVYNEEKGLGPLLEAFSTTMTQGHFRTQLVIVDDGSTDGTSGLIRAWSSKLSIERVGHPENRGLGESIRDALRRASEMARPEDIIVTMDADNTHNPASIPDMSSLIESGIDIVIASRYRPGSQVVGLGPFRRLMCYGARALFQMAFRIPGGGGYTCGFRVFRAGVLQTAFACYGDALVRDRKST